MRIQNVETASPSVIDTELARLYVAKLHVLAPYAALRDAKAKIEKHGARYYGYLVRDLPRLERRAKVALMIAGRIEREIESPLNAEFQRRGGWTRFFVVSGGHLHLRGCHSLRPRTLLGWVPEESGKDESQVVGKFGTVACTHCFPTAPVADVLGAIPKPGYCHGNRIVTGTASDPRRMYRYGRCQDCGTVASITSTGNLRKHKIETK
jgi:hypothetical protein